MPKEPRRSAFIDSLMKDVTEEARAEATERWFRVLEILIRMADTHAETCERCKEREGRCDTHQVEQADTGMPTETGTAPSFRRRPFFRL